MMLPLGEAKPVVEPTESVVIGGVALEAGPSVGPTGAVSSVRAVPLLRNNSVGVVVPLAPTMMSPKPSPSTSAMAADVAPGVVSSVGLAKPSQRVTVLPSVLGSAAVPDACRDSPVKLVGVVLV